MKISVLAAVLVAVVVVLAVAGCPADGTLTPPPPATSTPEPDLRCHGLDATKDAWLCYVTDLDSGQRALVESINYREADGAFDIEQVGDVDWYEVSLRGDLPYYITHCYPDGWSRPADGQDDCVASWQSSGP